MLAEPRIPFNRSSIEGKELEYIAQTVAHGQIAGNQGYSLRCQQLLKSTLGVAEALATTSCTHALEMAALLIGIKPGDEVIIPTFTFVSTANAFALRGAQPVFCDIRPDTLNMDEEAVSALITDRTKAIVPVHYAGVGCEMDSILETANRRGIAIVEDNAHGLFGKYKGKWLGTFGGLATQSFHETKNITCGEGGALLINDQAYVERAEVLREKGTNRSRFFRGQVDKYTWVDLGSSYVMSDVLAAFLFGQLEVWEEVQEKRRRIWHRYAQGLTDWSHAQGVRLPHVPEHCDQAYHMFYLLLPDGSSRDRFIAFLKQRGIYSVFHYIPLHSSPMGSQLGVAPLGCPVATDISERLVRLPFYNQLTQEDQDFVIEKVQCFQTRC